MTCINPLFGWVPVAVAVEHGFDVVAGKIIGCVAVHRSVDLHGQYMPGEALWRISHLATGHALTDPHPEFDECLAAAQRLAAVEDLAAINGAQVMLTEDIRRLHSDCERAAYPLTICGGTTPALICAEGLTS